MADEIINRLENKLFPGLKQSIAFREVMIHMQIILDSFDYQFDVNY